MSMLHWTFVPNLGDIHLLCLPLICVSFSSDVGGSESCACGRKAVFCKTPVLVGTAVPVHM